MSSSTMDRRELINIAGFAGVGLVFGSALGGSALAQGYGTPAPVLPEDFFFVQLSDLHWGFNDVVINPDPEGTLKKAIVAVNGLSRQPDFVLVSGDMIHATPDARERRRRMAEVKSLLGELRVKDIKYAPGDHDAAADQGEAYREFFGKPNYTFDHKGAHFVVLDNSSDKDFRLGDAQLAWLAADLRQLAPDTPVVVVAHRPLFDLYRPWGWFTPDGDKAMELLRPHKATVFYGHIHHPHHTTAGGLVHHAGTTLMLPLYPAGTRADRTMRPWDPAQPYAGMGWRSASMRGHGAAWEMQDQPLAKS